MYIYIYIHIYISIYYVYICRTYIMYIISYSHIMKRRKVEDLSIPCTYQSLWALPAHTVWTSNCLPSALLPSPGQWNCVCLVDDPDGWQVLRIHFPSKASKKSAPQFFLPYAQEKHSSIYVSIWACASSANKNRTYCSSSRTYYHINAVTEMEIGDVFTNRSVYSVKDCCKPLLLFLDHFFLSRTFFLHLLHSAGHASIHFSMPSFFPIYGRDLS